MQAPSTPDFSGMATQQGAANAEAARVSGRMSNPNIITPYGTQTVTWGGGGTPATEGHYETLTSASGQPYQQWVAGTPGTPGSTDQATITQKLTPNAEQTILEQQNAERRMAYLANHAGADSLENLFNNPFSFGGTPQQTIDMGNYGLAAVPGNPGSFQQVSGANYGSVQGAPNLDAYGRAQGAVNSGQAIGGVQAPNLAQGLNESGVAQMPVNAGTTAQQAIMSRLAPQMQQNRTSTETQLINQGLRPGSEAYDNAIRLLGQQENDQMTQAALQGLNLDFSANQQGFGQALTRGQFGNEAQLAGFGAGIQNINQINAATGQNFGQGLQAQESQNQALGQNQQTALAQQQAANQAQAQGFGNAQTMQGAQNQAVQQNLQNSNTYNQLMNARQQQGFGQQMQQAQLFNAAQQQALAQALQLRDVPFNEIAALLSGSQIQNPQFQAFQGQQVAPAPVMQAGQAQAGWDMSKYQQQVAQANALTQGLFSLGGAGASMIKPFSICWIAEAIYGLDDPRVNIVRRYLLGPFSEHCIGRAIVRLYRRYGQRVAKSKLACTVLKPFFDMAVKAGSHV